MGPAEDLHEWVSFEDPEEERTWVFDVTFLTSNWSCIYGRGCPGILTAPAPELELGCCTHGAHFTDAADHARVTKVAATLTDDEWQFRRVAVQRGGFAVRTREGNYRTRITQDACIFLNRPGFPTGAGCALHHAAVRRGERPMDLKPEVCWQVPVRRIDSTDEVGHVTSTVREWKRRDWGPGGDEFHWWCTDSHEAFIGTEPVYQTLRDDLVELTSHDVYRMLAEHLDARLSNGACYLPHPAVRRR